MKWKLLLGYCLAAASLLLFNGAPVIPVFAGLGLAVLGNWLWQRRKLRCP